MNIGFIALLFSTLLFHSAYCSVPSRFHYSSEWDESIQKCVEGIKNEVPYCRDYVLDKISKSQLQALARSDNRALKAVIRRFCVSYETKGRVCFHEYLEQIAPCLNEAQLHREKTFIRMAHVSWQTLCSHEGESSLELFSQSTVQCVQHHSYGLLQCLQMMQLRNFTQMLDHLTTLLLDRKCSMFSESTSCILRELQQCSDQSAAQIVQKEFEELLKSSPCNDEQENKGSKGVQHDKYNSTEDFHLYNGIAAAEIKSSHRTNEMDEDNEAVEVSEIVPDESIQKCIDNGDTKAYQLARAARQKLTQCGSSLLHTDRLIQEVQAAFLSNGQGMGPIVKKFCKSYQTSGRFCLDQYLHNLTPCLNETQKQVEELVVKMVGTNWEYFCQKDAYTGLQLFKNSTLSCLDMHVPNIAECITTYLGNFHAAGDPTHAIAEVLVNKECSQYSSFTNCVLKNVQQCPDQTAANIVRGSFSETQRISPCSGFVPSKMGKPEDYPQLTSTLLRFEATLQKLEENMEREHTRGEAIRNTIHTALEDQAKLLKQMTTSLDVVVSLIKQGKGRKWS